MTEVAVTGSTGQLGGRIARRLAAAGVSQRLLVREPARAPELPETKALQAEYADFEAVREALAGVGTALMISASESLDRVQRHRTFVDAAVDAGVRNLVYTSFFGAAPDATFTLARDHWATEEYIRASGLPFTFLRDNLYADFLTYMVAEDGVIRGPAGEGRVSAVAQEDIAEVATTVLLAPDTHAGLTYDLTGPEALSFAEIAAIIAAHTGRDIKYEAETVEEAYVSRAHYGAPDWQVDAWVSTYTAIAAGEMSGVSDAVLRVTGHPATALPELLRK
jgi:uncharacterized protein YbjT (DUF2867 family)